MVRLGCGREAARARHHVLLVPGFGGFDLLGPLHYYQGVVEYLRSGGEGGPTLSVHFFPNLPTASVPTRAAMLARWIGKRVHRGTIRVEEDPAASDRLHLVGHSTGGLDIRCLVSMLHRGRVADLFDFSAAPRRDALSRELLGAIETAQFLSTPHRGSTLARRARETLPLPRWLASGLFGAVRHLGPAGARASGVALGAAHGAGGPKDWVAAAADALSACHAGGRSTEAAAARRTYYDILHWLDEMRSEAGVLTSLTLAAEVPWGEAVRAPSPAEELGWYDDDRGIRARSIVTFAPVRRGDRASLYALLDRALRPAPSSASGPTSTLRLLLEPSARVTLGENDHDGIVGSLSMIWPDEGRSVALCGDHADVLGHYETSGPRGYDLLPSGAAFATSHFQGLWLEVRRFIVDPPGRQTLPDRRLPGARGGG